MSTTFEDLLARDGVLVYRIRGVSMEPLLRQDLDLVTIQAVAARLKKYDVALYKRGDAYVLHRVVAVHEDGYLIRGDNTYTLEAVPDEAVIGVMTGFQRKGRDHLVTDPDYRLYARLWHTLFSFRYALVRLRRLAVRVARRLGVLPLLKKLLGRG